MNSICFPIIGLIFTQISKISSQAWSPSVVGWSWLNVRHPLSCSLTPPQQQDRREDKMGKLIGWDEVSDQFNLLLIKIDLDGGKQTKTTHHHQASTQHFFLMLTFIPSLPTPAPPRLHVAPSLLNRWTWCLQGCFSHFFSSILSTVWDFCPFPIHFPLGVPRVAAGPSQALWWGHWNWLCPSCALAAPWQCQGTRT